MSALTAEQQRLAKAFPDGEGWKKWGPYLAERQWSTVREDYSPDGEAWDYFPHEHARSRAYRWGEDGLAGVCDLKQRLCLGLALWNGRDRILKERLFGLTSKQGNHGEDVKELYYYLDATPTHSYLKMLYKYPQAAFPYEQLVDENHRRDARVPEYEIVDTGIFDDNRYTDVLVEYAQNEPDDLLMRITATNRGPDTCVLHIIPQLWFRNTWSWTAGAPMPVLRRAGSQVIGIEHAELGSYQLYAEGHPLIMFCNNESNRRRMWGDEKTQGHWKDAFHDVLIGRDMEALNPQELGTKAGLAYRFDLAAGAQAQVRIRLSKRINNSPHGDFDAIMAMRIREADEFYGRLQDGIVEADARLIQRQAYAGMIWSKQFYHFDVHRWLNGDPTQPRPAATRRRNREWEHLDNFEIISMPDKWEYPWYAAWDLAFHCIPLAHLDIQFAKNQLVLLVRDSYMHPNGQIPAYEWAFGDVNPPVHAWSTWRVFQIDRKQRGRGDYVFLESIFHRLMLNFTWWVNRKDALGKNIFQGGFLGLDNIGVFDRSSQLPTGGYLDQADATSWMAMYCLNLMRIALELARHNHVYEDIAAKFFEHFLFIAKAMGNIAGRGIGLWNERDNFFYDVLHLPDGSIEPMAVRSIVGLIPLFAVETLEPELLEALPVFKQRVESMLKRRPDLAALISNWYDEGRGERRLLSLLRGHRMKQLLKRMLDESEFLSPFGIRALSRIHKDQPYIFRRDGMDLSVGYQPAESDSGLFGGNSNWRGPIWFPINYLLIESLEKFHHYYGEDFKVECPTGSGIFLTLDEVAHELATRLTRLFLKDAQGKRAVNGTQRAQLGPQFAEDKLLFFEYFDGDTGRGLGASHQTGWTGLVARLLMPRYARRVPKSFDPADLTVVDVKPAG
jgi:hypothetical protein